MEPPVLEPQPPADALTPPAAPQPYPMAWQRRFVTSDGLPLVIRPMRSDDELRMIAFHTGLSEQTVYWRYFRTLPLTTRIAHERLVNVCKPDLLTEAVLVVIWTDPVAQDHIVAVGRLADQPGGRETEFAVLVADAWQGRGVGRHLMSELIAIARFAGRRQLAAEVLPDNTHMQRMLQRLGFTTSFDFEDRVIKTRLALGAPAEGGKTL